MRKVVDRYKQHITSEAGHSKAPLVVAVGASVIFGAGAALLTSLMPGNNKEATTHQINLCAPHLGQTATSVSIEAFGSSLLDCGNFSQEFPALASDGKIFTDADGQTLPSGGIERYYQPSRAQFLAETKSDPQDSYDKGVLEAIGITLVVGAGAGVLSYMVESSNRASHHEQDVNA